MTRENTEGKDNILSFLVQVTNKHNVSIDITLNVNGSIVTGTIVSAKEYFESLSETFDESSEVAQQLSEKFAKAGEAIGSGDGGEASFIHLKDAKVFCGSSKHTPSKGDALWRGPLSDINGFFLENIPDNGEDDDESDNGDYQSLKEKNSKLTDRIGKLEEMIAKLSPEDEKEEKSEDESESDKKQDSTKETSNDEEKEKSQKKRSGTKSGSTKTKKKASTKKTAKSE